MKTEMLRGGIGEAQVVRPRRTREWTEADEQAARMGRAERSSSKPRFLRFRSGPTRRVVLIRVDMNEPLEM